MSTLDQAIFTHSAESLALAVPPSAIEHKYTYGDLQTQVKAVQAQIASRGIARGGVVSSSLVNSPEFVAVFLATAAEGLIAAPLNPAYKESEAHFYLEDTQTKLLVLPNGALEGKAGEGASAAARAAKSLGISIAEVVVDNGKITLVADGAPLPAGEVHHASEDDTALVLHTSGTTGRPKAVPLTHRNLLTSMINIRDSYKLSESDRTFLVMPLFHVHGLLCGLLASLLAGGSVVLPTRFSATTFWDDFVATGANWYTAVPTIHQILLTVDVPSPLPNIRFIRSCSSSLSPSTLAAIEDAFKAPVLEAYAMTEAAHQMTTNPLPPATHKPGTVGFGHGVEVRILNERGEELPVGVAGEVCVRGSNVTKGYVNNEKANRESFFRAEFGHPAEVDGFLRTGDEGKKDEDGYLQLTGRIKELINRSGEKISPLEVDAALLAIPSVQEAVSFSIPHEMYGEVVGAAVVLKSGSTDDQSSLQKALGEKLIKFKIPERIWIVDAIPKTATGKIQRRIVAAEFVGK
ncbi:oxalate--CoA ligase [Malassezia cuniculi]|uniref:Oxalate--CoA ligase n=1 Tax=Malassezia cuniculi TaxID=948313 RepID=A0AAF0J7R1_9BASI|nr:oxalate--CoA ligase [Malassezia cuniculi]